MSIFKLYRLQSAFYFFDGSRRVLSSASRDVRTCRYRQFRFQCRGIRNAAWLDASLSEIGASRCQISCFLLWTTRNVCYAGDIQDVAAFGHLLQAVRVSSRSIEQGHKSHKDDQLAVSEPRSYVSSFPKCWQFLLSLSMGNKSPYVLQLFAGS